ncbi:TetR family transcriptional regulator C-terminal domain-containing protein [Actinoallomurus sp. CA-150999]|uniref:TetR family transcriptional regulator C-terminal domain-containing protein n=1 Tax=Actinoallomurus sp. CA-150999 TaxID=3239887 RepID=UPI003D949565
MTTAHLEILEDQGRPAIDRIRALLDEVVDSEEENRRNGHSGCLTVNTTVEFAGRDPEIARLLDRDLSRRLEVLRGVIEVGRHEGGIASARDPGDLARFVNAVIAGIRVAARGGADRTALTAIAATAMDALTPGSL